MKDFDNILLSQMADITGLSAISIWPLAVGWWILIFIFLAILAFILIRIRIKILYRRSWKYKVEKELNDISEDIKSDNVKESISKINDILKRLSIQIYGREESASLIERKWLIWLTDNDPSNFNWLKKGEILINYPYMQEEKIKASMEDVALLAKAVKPWLKSL